MCRVRAESRAFAAVGRERPYGESMPRRARSTLPEFGTFHVISRGVARSAIVRDDLDREAFVRLELSTRREYGWICHAYCLMTNHYHLVVSAGLERLSRGMHRLNGVHASRFNARYDRPGHLFQDRFASRIVPEEDDLVRVCRYVFDNPVRAGLCAHADDWPWSGGEFRPLIRR
jgi:putative transposase